MKSLFRLIVVLGLMPALFAQTASKTSSDQPAKKDVAEHEPRPDNYYKLAFTIFEVEDGKRTNQREYSMIARTEDGRPTSVKASTRVPISSPEKQIQYIDAGLDIRCFSPHEIGSKITANCDINISNFVLPEQSPEARNSTGPVLRTTNAVTWAVLAPGKPTIISTIDDINSKKRIQIEMTATKID